MNDDKKLQDFQYKNKLRSGIISFILFLVLSNKVSYKVLNVILSAFNNSIQVIDDDENPLMLGTVILGIIFGLIIFLS